MGIFDKIKDAFKETDLVQDLVDHLLQIGVQARVIDTKSIEAVKHHPTLGIFGNPPLGVVKIDGRNIDVVELYREVRGGGGGGLGPGGRGYHSTTPSEVFYYYDYVVCANVGDKEENLKAEVHPIEKGLLHKELVDFEWKGGSLAKSLNADQDLKKMILESGAPRLLVKPDKKDECVAIKLPQRHITVTIAGIPVRHDFTVGRKAFPSAEAFEIYDSIAKHIRSEAGA